MLCCYYLQIFKNFTLDPVFCKWSLMGRGSLGMSRGARAAGKSVVPHSGSHGTLPCVPLSVWAPRTVDSSCTFSVCLQFHRQGPCFQLTLQGTDVLMQWLLRNTNGAGTQWCPFLTCVMCPYLPITDSENDDTEGKGKIGHTQFLFLLVLPCLLLNQG